jgi:thiol-disulfide isomerase/thioredoxin
VEQSAFAEDPSPDTPLNDGSSRRSVAWILAFFAVAVLALLVIQFFAPSRDLGTDQTALGHSLPDLRLEPLTGDGQPVRLGDLAGKVVLLDFWGTWCPPCRAEFPHIVALADKYRDRSDFELLAVSCGSGGDDTSQSLRPATEAFLQDRKLDVATYFDPQGYTRREVDKVAGFEGYPTTLVLDRQGVIRGMWVSYEPGTERHIGELVAKLLAETPAKKDSPL